MLVLAIDTSTPTVTAGVVTVRSPHELIDEQQPPTAERMFELRAQRSLTDALAHAEQLMPLCRAALADAGGSLGDLDAIAVGLGPGPYTGLRVGIATAAALGDALDRSVHGVPSHDAVAAITAADEPFLVVTDARRREVYLSGYQGGGRRVIGPLVVAPADVPALLAEHQLRPAFRTGAGSALLDIDVPERAASDTLARGLAMAAGKALLTGVVPGPLEALYLRRPDATEPAARKSVLGR